MAKIRLSKFSGLSGQSAAGMGAVSPGLMIFGAPEFKRFLITEIRKNVMKQLMHDGYKGDLFLLVLAFILIVIPQNGIDRITFAGSSNRSQSRSKKDSTAEAGTTLGNFVTIPIKLAGLIDTGINPKEGNQCFWRMEPGKISDFSQNSGRG